MDAHPAAELFPLLTGAEFETFKADIATQGLLEPIWLYEGKILDGRNRYRACIQLGLVPTFREYAGPSPVTFVWSLNGERRHLTHGQRAAIAVEMLPELEEEAKKRQLSGLRRGQQSPVPTQMVERETQRNEASRLAADIVGASATSVNQAKAVKRADPKAFDGIRGGLLKVAPAYAALRKRGLVGLAAKGARYQPREVRVEAIARLAKEGNRSQQIGEEIGLSGERVRELARRAHISLPDAVIGHASTINIHRVVEQSVNTLEGVALGLKTVTGGRLDCSPEEAREWTKSLDASLRIIGKLRKILRGSFA